MSKYILFALLLFSSSLLVAQSGSMTEEEIAVQNIFMDGNREKLLGNWDKAIDKFLEVLERDKRNAAAAYELARVYEANKDMERAEKFAAKAVDWEPTNVWFQMYLAEVYQKVGKDGSAAAVYEQLVKMEPLNRNYYLQWAYYLVRNSEPELAIKVYNELEKKMGISVDVTRHKHTLYLGMGDHKKAAAELEALIEKFPTVTSYRHLLGVYYEQIGEKGKAREVYRDILVLAPDDARAKIALAEEAKGTDDIRFLNSLKPVFEDPKTDVDTKIKEILPYVNQLASSGDQSLGNTLLALTSLLETVHPENAKSHSVLADVLYYTGQTDRALSQYRKTLEIDETVWAVWEQMLYILADNKDYDELVDASEDALDIFPNQAVAYYLNGAGYNGKGEYQDALSSLQQALIMSSRNPRLRYDVLNETGKSYFHLRQYAKSDNAFEEALKINDMDPVVLKNYSHYLAARPNANAEVLEKAKTLATRLNEVAPNHPVSESALGFVFFKMKDFTQAREWLDKSLGHGGGADPTILELYGDVLFQLGQETEAVQYWQKALDQGGDSKILKKKVSEGKFFE